MERKYTVEEIRNMLDVAVKKKTINMNTSFDDFLSGADIEIEPVKIELEFKEFFITHKRFELFCYIGIFDEFLIGINKFSELEKQIIELSQNYWQIIDDKTDEDYTEDMLKGDLFEIFAELFFKITKSDNRVGISDYLTINEDDYGVDGVGRNYHGQKCTIQVKFRSNPMELLTIKDLKNFQGISYKAYDVDPKLSENLIIFTNCQGIHWNTETNVMKSSTLTFGNYGISNDKSLSAIIIEDFGILVEKE
jgi:DNA replicative helicase MCM subunit Mcm2 (Cdc46/Mcm family)